MLALSGDRALAVARERFKNLCANGILGVHARGEPVDPDHVERAMNFLRRCRKTKRPTAQSADISLLTDIQTGAVVAAATALGFDVRTWYGVTAYPPFALIAVNQTDVRRVSKRDDRFDLMP